MFILNYEKITRLTIPKMDDSDIEFIENKMENIMRKNKDCDIADLCQHFKHEIKDVEIKTTISFITKLKEIAEFKLPSEVKNVMQKVYSAFNAMEPVAVTACPIAGVILRIGSQYLTTPSSDNLASTVEQQIQKVLRNSVDQKIEQEAESTISKFRISQAFICANKQDHHVNDHEVAAIASFVPIYEGVAMLHTLKREIKNLSVSKMLEDVKRAMRYLELFSVLQAFRLYLLMQTFTLIKGNLNSKFTANALFRVIENEMKTVRDSLKFLSAPSYEHLLFCVNFNLSEWPNTQEFLEGTYTPYQLHDYLESGIYTLRTEKWQSHVMTMSSSFLGWCEASKTSKATDQSKFKFEAVSLADSTFRIRSCKWPSFYVVMSYFLSYCRGSKAKDPQGEWKIVRFEDNKYMICLARWPDKFMHMRFTSSGSIDGKRNPHRAGRWILEGE